MFGDRIGLLRAEFIQAFGKRLIMQSQNAGCEQACIGCARFAPTAMGKEPWEFVVVTERSTLERLADLTDYGKFIAQATSELDADNRFSGSLVSARYNGEFKLVTPETVQLMGLDAVPFLSVMVTEIITGRPLPSQRRVPSGPSRVEER